MKMKRGKNKSRKMMLLLIVLGLVLGFATVTTTLKITGFTLIRKHTWDIKWDRNSIMMGEDMPAGITEPVVSTSPSGSTDDTVSFSADLVAPGDYYEFYIDAINSGAVNGIIESIDIEWKSDNKIVELPDFLDFTIVYADTEEAPVENDILYHGQSKTYRIRLEYKEDVTTLATQKNQYVGTISIVYGQGDDSNPPSENAIGPGAETIEEEAQESPSANPEETVNPVVINRATVTDTGTDNDIEGGDTISYMGDEPNNFIYFNCNSLDAQNSDNCELWRVIGIDKDNGNRIKIIREDSIGRFVWNDDSVSDMTNNWENSSLKTYLNTTYYDSLSTVSKQLIPTVTWYNVGGYNVLRLNERKSWYGDQISGMTGASLYVNERTKFQTTNPNFNRNNVQAKVGLMYASDYAYASAACFSNCVSTGAYPCRLSDYCIDVPGSVETVNDFIDGRAFNNATCRNSNWLYKDIDEWTMTASMYNNNNSVEQFNYRTNSYYSPSNTNGYCRDPNKERKFESTYPANTQNYHEDYHYVIIIKGNKYGGSSEKGGMSYDTTDGRNSYAVDNKHEVRPVVYLKSGVDLTGTGSRSDPFKIVADASILNTDETSTGGSSSSSPTTPPDITKQIAEPTCGDSKAPSCKLNYVRPTNTGFEYSFNCTDNSEINRIVSDFSTNPSGENYGARTFERIGLIRQGKVLNNGKTKSYTGKWTRLSTPPAKKNTNYYFTYGGEDKCGNWVLYTTPQTYSFS